MTPYYDDGKGIVIYHGDCREVLPSLSLPGCVLLTDPPYGVEGGRGGDARDFGKSKYVGQWEDTPAYIGGVCVPVVSYLLFLATRGAITPGVRCIGLYPKPSDMGCFWTPASTTHGPWGFACNHPILYYGKDYRAGIGALPSGKQVTERADKNGHPCPKPIQAWKWLMDKVSKPGELVVDPFAGSGTTLVSALELGRRAIGIEIEERYCEIAAKRLSQDVLPLEKSA